MHRLSNSLLVCAHAHTHTQNQIISARLLLMTRMIQIHPLLALKIVPEHSVVSRPF